MLSSPQNQGATDIPETTQWRWDISLDRRYLKAEKVFVVIFLLTVSLTLAHFVHEGWFDYNARSGENSFVSWYSSYAPMAYRVAIRNLGLFLMRVLSIPDSSIVASVLDFCFSFPALYLFYRLTVKDFSSNSSRMHRILAIAFFLAFIQFPIAWVLPWKKPETLPTALYLAASLTLLASDGKQGLRTGLLLALTASQAFVRSDVPFIFGIALIVASLIKDSVSQFGTRWFNFIRGVAIAAIAASIQLYLQLVLYPHLSYAPGTDVIQLHHNLSPHNLANLVLALLPLFPIVWVLIKGQLNFDAVDTVILLASAIYLPLWCTVGVVSEVRVYVPFMLALSVVSAKTSVSLLINQPSSSAEHLNRMGSHADPKSARILIK